MICALCKLEKELRESHIVPEFMYQQMYDKKHAFMALSREPIEANRYFKKGLREKLLCADCETKFSKWESYAADIFYNNRVIPKKDGMLIFFENLDYEKLKLFFLSLLWRFAVTSLPEFKGAELIEKHKEKLRLMLLNGYPGDPLDFPCFVQVVIHNGKNLAGFHSPPMSARYEAHRVWQFVVDGFYFMFFVSSHRVTSKLAETFLTKQGKMVFVIEELTRIRPLYEFYLELGNALRQRKQLPKSQLRFGRK